MNKFENGRSQLPTVESGIITRRLASLAETVSMTVNRRLSQWSVGNLEAHPAFLEWSDGKNSFLAAIGRLGFCTFFKGELNVPSRSLKPEKGEVGIRFDAKGQIGEILLNGQVFLNELRRDFSLPVPQGTDFCKISLYALEEGRISFKTFGTVASQGKCSLLDCDFYGFIGTIETNLFPPTSST